MKKTLDKELKAQLNRLLREMGLLTENTENIVLNCNDGEISDIKQTLRFK